MATGYNNPDYLYRLARSGTPEDRETLARSITSLLHADLTKGEMYLAQDILLHMLREAEMDLRQSLALQLSVEDKCPKALLDYLIFDCPFSVSEPVLKNSKVLTDNDLIEIAKRFDMPEYWRTIAGREQVSKDLALFLIGTDDEEVYHILVQNHGSEFCSLCMNWLTGIAINMPPLQEPLLQRKEITPELATKIYWYASDKLKEQIVQRFDIDKSTLERALKYVVDRRIAQKSGVNRISMEMMGVVSRLPKITSRQIVDAMERNDMPMFACLCGVYLKLNPEKVLHRLEVQPVLALSVLCRAVNLTRAEYNSLFLMMKRHSGQSVVNSNELTHAMAIFDGMKIEQAKAEVATWINTAHSTAQH